MTAVELDLDPELQAISRIYDALKALDDEGRKRVLEYVSRRYGLAAVQERPVAQKSGTDEADMPAEVSGAPTFGTLAELFDAARPQTNYDKALVAGYWLQVCQKADSFGGFEVNKDLKNLGEGLANVTTAIDVLRDQKPALVLQLKKSGTSQQARKTYKLTNAGIKAVEAMIANG
jgi:hypothetical protein